MSSFQPARLKTFLATAAVLAVAAALPGSARAQMPGKQYFGIGAGGGMMTHFVPCPDIPCNGGDTCSCITASGSADFRTISGKAPPIAATFTLEVSGDNSTRVNNGGGGGCYAQTGVMVLTINNSTLTIPFSGPGCRLGTAVGRNAFGVSVPAYIESGTGRYTTAQGTGTLAATFDPDGGTVLLTLDGYGIF